MSIDLERDTATLARAGLSGVLVRPDASRGAGVIVIGGSEGGYHERDAVAFAEQGYVALALAYFGAPGVPPSLKEIPLEYFFRAIDVVHEQEVTGVALVGGSRGGEAALLVASHDPRVTAVVSVVGSGVVTAGIDYRQGRFDRIIGTPTVAWTLAGQPLPALPYRVPDGFSALVDSGPTVALSDYFAPLPSDPAELERISIPVERSRAAVLMIAGEDDRMWDAAAYHAVAAARLERAGHPYAVENIVLPGAGHCLAGPPAGPITATMSPGPGVTFLIGGDPATNTAARQEAWDLTLRFLHKHTRA